MSREPADHFMTRSTICVLLVAVMGLPLRLRIVPSFLVFLGAQE